MTIARTDGPTPLSRVWAGGKIIAEDLTGEDLGDVLELHSDAYAWWVLERDADGDTAQLRDLARALDLDEFAVRDLTAEDQRAKYEQVGSARLLLTNFAELDTERSVLTPRPVSLIVSDRILICLSDRWDGFHPAQLLRDHADRLAHGGVEVASQLIITAVVNSYDAVQHWLEDASDQLADALFEERPLTRSEQLWAFRLRTVLSRLRRLTDPMRDVITDLVQDSPSSAKPKHAPSPVRRSWTMLEEHHHRVANAADALRETLSSVFDTSLSLADVRMNTIMKRLTGWAAIIAVPTLVTGFVGMNVSFPLDGTRAGFWVYFVLMVMASVVLYLVFRRKDWV